MFAPAEATQMPDLEFWDFAINYHGHKPDAFADFVRLIRMGKIHPRRVETQHELRDVLYEEGVDLPVDRRDQIWRAYLYKLRF